jgi:indole-3-glycerol phosphate synthase
LPNILDKIIADKKLEVQQLKENCPLERLRSQIADLPRCRNFYKAVTKKTPGRINVIAEVKKASPSAGVIRENFDPAGIARIYQNSGAAAISCLTDEKYFQGRLDYIAEIKKNVSLPVMRKDFIVEKYQVYQSRVAGADAILLIVEALKPAQLMDLLILANQLGLTALIESHKIESIMQMRSLLGFPNKSYSILGINNRDLTTMQVDINNTLRLAELVDDKQRLVAESGIKNREDVQKLIDARIGAVLIGQTLCESPDIAAKFRELFG